MCRIIFLEPQSKTIPNTYLTLVVGLEAPPALKSGHGAHKGTPRTRFGSCPRRWRVAVVTAAGGSLPPHRRGRSERAKKCAEGREALIAGVHQRCADAGRQRVVCEQLPGCRASQAARLPLPRPPLRIRVSTAASAVRSTSLVGAAHLAAAERTSSARFSQHSRSAASSGLRPARVIRTGRRWGQSGQRGPCPGRGKGTWRCAATRDCAR